MCDGRGGHRGVARTGPGGDSRLGGGGQDSLVAS